MSNFIGLPGQTNARGTRLDQDVDGVITLTWRCEGCDICAYSHVNVVYTLDERGMVVDWYETL